MSQAIPLILLIGPALKRPLWGGILLLLLGIFAVRSFANVLRGPEWAAPFLILVAPFLLSGFLFLGVAWLEQRAG